MTYHTPWYHYLVVIFFYLINGTITSAFIYSFTLNQWYTIYLRIPISALFLIIVLMIIITHTHAMITNNAINPVHYICSDFNNPNKVPDCPKCLSDRPQRAHHCSACDVCIKRMDHHCPWIANCVGEGNQKSFLLLLFYSLIGTCIACLGTIKSFIDTLVAGKDITLLVNHIGVMNSSHDMVTEILEAMTLFGFILSMIMGISLVILLIIQVNELRYGMTAIEFKIYRKNEECPYYNNDLKGNFISLFGSSVLLWFLPMNTENQEKDIQLENHYVALQN